MTELVFLLASWAPKMNLTGHRTPDAIARRLVLDAVALACQLPAFDGLIDLGSGAGFPGLPIAIVFSERSITTVDSRSRRVFFQRHVVRELGLNNVEVLEGRIEDLEPQQRDCVVAQALAPPVQVLDYMVPWCRDGGVLAIPGTVESLKFQPPANILLMDCCISSYRVPFGDPDRQVWIGRKRPEASGSSPQA